jgi:hypothetical protein
MLQTLENEGFNIKIIPALNLIVFILHRKEFGPSFIKILERGKRDTEPTPYMTDKDHLYSTFQSPWLIIHSKFI